MRTALGFVVLAVLLSAATGALADQYTDNTLPPIALVPLPGPQMAPPEARTTTTAGVFLYKALTQGSGFIPSGSAGVGGSGFGEYADDLHLVAGGELGGITIGYHAPTGPVDVTITLYQSTATDAFLGAPVAGPYTFTNLPGGTNVVTLTPPDDPVIPQDVWFGYSFIPGTAGLINAPDPSPEVGSSHDFFIDTTEPGIGVLFLDGGIQGNFMIALTLGGILSPVMDIKPGSCPNPFNVKLFEFAEGRKAKKLYQVKLLRGQEKSIQAFKIYLRGKKMREQTF